MFGSIVKASRDFINPYLGISQQDKLVRLCHDLLSEKGEASGIVLAWTVLETYRSLTNDQKLEFFNFLDEEMSLEPENIQRALNAYNDTPDEKTLAKLILAAEPKRQELICRMNMSPHGIYSLVSMRRDLLSFLFEHRNLKSVDNDFRALFASLFNRGCLNLRRIDWKTPAHILEKLIAYESVHEIKNWDDLHRRLDSDRRCFAFFHPAFGDDEPLIFIEVALADELSKNIQSLINLDQAVVDSTQVNTAVFYSINNCQPGLKGISLGNFLI